MIGVALGLSSTSKTKVALKCIGRSADIVELRLDVMTEYDLPELLRDRPCPVIVTNRPEREGGRFRGSETERVRPLREAIDLGVEYVDIEHDASHLIGDRKDTGIVISRHDFRRVPNDILEIHRELVHKGADVVKIVGMAHRITDNLRVLEALAISDLPMISIAMGEAGLISRILALRHESCFLTYATLSNELEVAPGQLPIETMRQVYRAGDIGAKTTVYGIISSAKVSDSLLSKLNSATRDTGLNAVWLPFQVSEADVDDPTRIVQEYRSTGAAGYIVDESIHIEAGSELDAVLSSGSDGRINVIRIINDRIVGEWLATLSEAFSLITGTPATLSYKSD